MRFSCIDFSFCADKNKTFSSTAASQFVILAIIQSLQVIALICIKVKTNTQQQQFSFSQWFLVFQTFYQKSLLSIGSGQLSELSSYCAPESICLCMFCMQVLLWSFGTVKTENQKLLRGCFKILSTEACSKLWMWYENNSLHLLFFLCNSFNGRQRCCCGGCCQKCSFLGVKQCSFKLCYM